MTGLPAAGKSSVGAILKSSGFRVYEIGDAVRDIMRRRGIPLTPESDRIFTVKMRRKHGRAVFVKLLLRNVRIDGKSKVAIIGIRSRADLRYVKKRGRILTMAIVAPIKLRYERIRKRGRPDMPRSLAEFRVRDRREERFGLLGAIRGADFVVSGAGTIPQLRKEVREILASLS